jgi:DNA-binding MarR family transcriptional regulator
MSAPGQPQPAALAAASGENEPLALLHFAFRAVVSGPDAVLARRGLGRVHHRILFFVARAPAMSVGELTAVLGITKQALHRPLQELVRGKLVELRPDPMSGRVRRLRLTATGAALERRLSGEQRRLFADAFRQAGPSAAAGWRAVMHALMTPAFSATRSRASSGGRRAAARRRPGAAGSANP